MSDPRLRAEREWIARQAGRLLAGLDLQVSGETELAKLLELCAHHELLALAGHRIQENPLLAPMLDTRQVERISAAKRMLTARRGRALTVLKDALDVLAPVSPVLFKGLAAASYWPETNLRPPGDVDLLVSEEEFSAATDTMKTAGWKEMETVHGHLPDTVAANHGFARMFRHPQWPLAVDLHRRVCDDTEPFPLGGHWLLDSAQERDLGEGISVLVPRETEHTWLTALHSIRQGTFRLHSFLDLYWIVEAMRDQDNIDISEYKEGGQILRPVRVAFFVAETLLGVQFKHYPRGEWSHSLARAVDRRSPGVIARGYLGPRGGVRRVHALLDLLPSLSAKLGYLLRVALPAPDLVRSYGGQPHPKHYLAHRTRAGFRALQSLMRSEKDS
jgi:hypothetical protein